MMCRRRRLAGLFAVSSAIALTKCTSGDAGVPGAGAAGQVGAASGAATMGAAGTGGATALPGDGHLSIGGISDEPSNEGGGGTDVSRDDACATSTDRATALPAVVQLVVDTSGSMDWP